MSATISDVFDLPKAEDIRAMGFVIKLRESMPDATEIKTLVDDYVITPAVEKELPRILDDMKQVFDRGEEYGRFIHGSFGSGKSHFMTMLSLLMEGEQQAWEKFRPLLQHHRQSAQIKGKDAADHEAWLHQADLLVVRIHMLSVRGRSTSFDRAIYDGLNATLKRHKKEPFEFLNVDGIFEEVRREASEYGDQAWKRLEVNGIVGGREDFESLARGSIQGRERFARAWLKYKGRNPEDAGIDPRWSEGIRRMAEHVKLQGFGGIVLMIDEFLLWLAEKSGQEFVQEINNLNVIVDHNTGQRPLPIYVFVARQRNLQEFFPDLVDESKIHEHLDHHAKRFEVTPLQDIELRHIVHGRVLRAKDPSAIQKAVNELALKQEQVLPALLSGGDAAYLRDVYPFHPALIEMLVDVTALMQRERSALRLLYELLVIHYPHLPLGEFLPVGSAFTAIFPESGVEASKKVETMQDIHHQYYSRLSPAIRQMAREMTDFGDDRKKALDQLVKTVLLAEVSPRLKQSGLTIERLVQLNSADVEGETFRGRVRVAETDLLALAQLVPDLQIAGQGKTAVVGFVLGRISLGDVLQRARSKVDNPAKRFEVFWPALRDALGVSKNRGFEEGGPNDGDWEFSWRRTWRKGRLKLGNVRDMTYTDFEAPEGAFKVLVDYPWDEPGHTVDEDRHKALTVRKDRGIRYTACWLPRHLTTQELAILTDLAAVRYLLTEAGQRDLLDMLGVQDRNKVLDLAAQRQRTLEGQFDELLKEVYIKKGEIVALISDVTTQLPLNTMADNLGSIAAVLMDRRYPQHPHFINEPKANDLKALLHWMIHASEGGLSVGYDETEAKALKTLGQPLELVELGQTKASLRLDSRYLKDVLQRTDHDSVSWDSTAEHLRTTYGFQDPIIDLFLCFLCQRDHRALHEVSGERIDPSIGMSRSIRIRLQRGQLVSGADWGRLRDLGHQLFDHPRPPAHRSLQGQDKFVDALQKYAKERRTLLQGLHETLIQFQTPDDGRLEDFAVANTRLAPLAKTTTDSYRVLTDLLALWPDDASDPIRGVVHEAVRLRETVNHIDESARTNLEHGVSHPSVGQEVQDHLQQLKSHLAARQHVLPLTKDWITNWNQIARSLVQRLIAQVQPVQEKQHTVESPAFMAAQRADSRNVLLSERLDASDPDAMSEFLAKVRQALSSSKRQLRISLVIEEDEA